MYRRFKGVAGLAGVVVLAAVVSTLWSGCGGGSATSGMLQVGLTDAQSDTFQKVVVAIKEVRVVPTGMESAPDSDPRLPVVISFTNPRVVDILTLKFQQMLLGSIILPPGTYSQVRLILEPNPNGQANPSNYLTLTTSPTVKIPLTTPSAQQSGLKVLGQFTVKAGVINTIVLDFDPNTAIVPRGNGDYNIKPTGIRIVQAASPLTAFGSLTGTVTSLFRNFSTATVSVVPQGTATSVASGTVFSSYSGSRWTAPFSAFVPGGAYRLHVESRGFARYSSPVKTVTTGSDTPLGDLFLAPLVP